jgi:membrane-associated protein
MADFFQQVWQIVATVADPRNLTDPEKFQEAFRQPGVFWAVFVAVTAVVFTETGLLVGFLLPGDSMLVVLGFVASPSIAGWGQDRVLLLVGALCVAAVAGDTVGYWIGAKSGPAIFNRPDRRFFKQKYLTAARDYYDKHGGKTIVLARFIPIVRTFVPVVAGAARMEYKRFLAYNVVGGVAWIVSMFAAGYFLVDLVEGPLQRVFGQQFRVAKNIDKVVVLVVLASVAPMVLKAVQQYRSRRKPPAPPVAVV